MQLAFTRGVITLEKEPVECHRKSVDLISAVFAEIKKVRQHIDEPYCLPKAVFILQAGNKGPLKAFYG
jgi:hypothetical protein